MFDPGDTKWSDFGDTAWPSFEVFSDESFGDRTSVNDSARSGLGKGHIRLVKIQPGDRDNVIRCHTQIFLLERAEEYTALSYTWGSTFPSQPIEIDGQLLMIPENLWRFLRQARQRPHQFSGWLWIDMLSIDQECALERTRQVGIMSDIFQSAGKVVVWVGPAYRESDKAFEAMSKAESTTTKTLTRICSGPVGSAIQNLCERPYWRRLWVFQELKFARNTFLMCGKRLLPWYKFEMFLLYARAHDRTPRLKDKVDSIINSPAGTMVELTLTSLDTSLWALLLATKHLRCAVPHDKVYALLSVAKLGHEDISADYTIPIPILLNRILRNMHALLPPRKLGEVAAQCETLETLFDVPSKTLFTLSAQSHLKVEEASCSSTAYRLGPSKYDLSLWWTKHYDHITVQKLLLQAWEYRWFEGSRSPTDEEIQSSTEILRGSCFDVNGGPKGHRYIQSAIGHGNHAVLKLLLGLPGLEVKIENDKGESPLLQAIAAGRPEIVSELLASAWFDIGDLSLDDKFWNNYKTMPQALRDILKEAMARRKFIAAEKRDLDLSAAALRTTGPLSGVGAVTAMLFSRFIRT